MIREAGPDDLAAAVAILLRDASSAMFLIANLRGHGLAAQGFANGHFNAMRVWLTGADEYGVIGLAQGGMLLPMLPRKGDLGILVRAFAGLEIAGAIGPQRQVRDLLAALGLAARPMVLNKNEPGFTLNLADLRVPTASGARLVVASDAHSGVLVERRRDYHLEILGTPALQVLSKAKAEIATQIDRGKHRLLLVSDEPVAGCGFNAQLPEIVRIGGVYTSPTLRNRAYARQAVGLNLTEARSQRVVQAVLFAASEAASRAYLALGFQPSAPSAFVLFDGPQRVTA